MYAAYLCSTQVGSKINPDGEPIDATCPLLITVIHGGATRAQNRRHLTVRLVLRHPDHRQHPLDLDPRQVVTVEDPS